LPVFDNYEWAGAEWRARGAVQLGGAPRAHSIGWGATGTRRFVVFISTMYVPNAHDPCKDPAWRWRRRGSLRAHDRHPSGPRDDARTREAWHFRRDLAHCRTDADRAQLALDHPGLAEAHAVYTGEPLRRGEVEARILAGGDDNTIAGKMG